MTHSSFKATISPLTRGLVDIRNTLVYLRRIGCTGFDCTEEGLTLLSQLGFPPAMQETTDTAIAPAVAENNSFPSESLDQIRSDLGKACTRCLLHRERTHIVFGEGDPRARLVFVGEGPGLDEDQSGRPFVGKAGELLTNIIKAMKLSREAVYIANVVKCRPPGNRAPTPDEIRCCLPFLHRQLMVIQPQVICTLGSVAASAVLNRQAPISRIRGTFQQWNSIWVMPTFHPAFLLRNPDKKRDVWNDMQEIMKKLAE